MLLRERIYLLCMLIDNNIYQYDVFIMHNYMEFSLTSL